ncbi:ammecr1 [Anaeramoeba ignava]|uniref:Ammecr1 n=1 Tax=Anaeramoeba ignava TaxID=1746090 RepID=A0A9Q0R8J4_ANAIG|nr:ammecr1 [Anaeramoeba ignava]
MEAKIESKSIEATKEMGYLCFEAIKTFIEKTEVKKELFDLPKVSCPLFVTYDKLRDKEYELRGCIGTFGSQPLIETLIKYSRYSAFHDSRFSPVGSKELPYLRCTVSLLTNFEQAKNYLDWEVGKHGIEINFGSGYSATFLPEVAEEENWDKETTIKHLVRKAGYYGQLSKSFKESIKLTRYQSSIVQVTYDEYIEWRKTI